MIKSPNGFNTTENATYVLTCNISASNPNPITRYEWLQDGNIVNATTDTLSFSSVRRNDTGNWTCKGVIDKDGVKIEKKSNPKPVLVFCK